MFRARHGHGDELAGLFKEWFGRMAAQSGMVGARLYTDATGLMFSVIAESDFEDMAAYSRFFTQDQEMYSDPEFQTWFARMQELTEHGERQLLHMEHLA